MVHSTNIRSNLNSRRIILLPLRRQTRPWHRTNERNLSSHQRGRKRVPKKRIHNTWRLRDCRRYINRHIPTNTYMDKRKSTSKRNLIARILLWRIPLSPCRILRNGHRHKSKRQSRLRRTRRLKQSVPNRLPRRRSHGTRSSRLLTTRNKCSLRLNP